MIHARALAAVSVASSLVLAGCSPRTEVDALPPPQSEKTTLHQYIVDNKITESRFKRNDPGTPKVEFASPPGWRNAGDRTPEWAFGAIVYDKPTNPEDPPYMTAIASRLAGNVDPAKILEYAPGQLNDLPGFTPFGPPTRSSLSGFPAIDYSGTFDGGGTAKAIGQITIAVPGRDEMFVFQLNAVAPQGEEQVVVDAARLIVSQTRISAPS